MLQGNRLKIKGTSRAADVRALIRYRRLSIRLATCALVTQMRARTLRVDRRIEHILQESFGNPHVSRLLSSGVRINSIFLPRKRVLSNPALKLRSSEGRFLYEERQLTEALYPEIRTRASADKVA